MNHSRTVVIDSLVNHRDLGGLRAVDSALRPGVLCRSAGLAALDGPGRAALRRSVSLVIDLRSEREATAAPAAAHPRTVRLPLLDGDASGMLDLPTLSGLYADLLDSAGSTFAQVARLVAEPADGAVLVHCTAGKDRTGLAVALVLNAVGVDRDAIVADYALSETHLNGTWADGMMSSVRAMGIEVSPRIEALITRSPAPVMEETLGRLDSRYGGAASYLTAHGLGEETLQQLRRRLLLAVPAGVRGDAPVEAVHG
ncbi:tyrosine-protein phosphatase [Streptomyces sp. NBC_00237]|uniref:tyrosine-protein phosphatase n=1 Tax=Streptomyces sp. NBC_00237 TaxID=2975687 RepID=UPI002252A71B|nr:tyrosine-protein phosphatase [Streptomyces sp. NBC_00237]MCX5205853.1 tyrosine-protein phosphatase [Streptomyces sp. NBC_00237]